MPYANNKGADQPAHPCRLISTFVVRCLDGIIPLVSMSEISNLYLASLAAQTGLIKIKRSSFKSNENIHKKEDGSYYVFSTNKASSVTLL